MAHIRQLVARGVRLDGADYDLRTPLHLAAAEGHAKVVQFLLDEGVDASPRDRWGRTPLDDAERHDKPDVVELLKQRETTAIEARDGSADGIRPTGPRQSGLSAPDRCGAQLGNADAGGRRAKPKRRGRAPGADRPGYRSSGGRRRSRRAAASQRLPMPGRPSPCAPTTVRSSP